ncbi:MAG: hypothetical protein HQM13_15800 [SAR324 cluster bacterium]|nr:hypothetical protein [SAR324 cluster bacterium]
MPRQIDLKCAKCGFVEEVQQEILFFEDEEPRKNPCPECQYPFRMELPPRVNIHTEALADSSQKLPKKLPKLTPDGILPEDVRKLFAKELFDPCSCGEHAPADLDEHDADCHVQNHSFMKNKELVEEK